MLFAIIIPSHTISIKLFHHIVSFIISVNEHLFGSAWNYLDIVFHWQRTLK